MDSQKLKFYASRLTVLLDKYATRDAEAEGLKYALASLLRLARDGEISEIVEWEDIPGVHSFDQGNLRKYPDLEEAFSDFAIEVADEYDQEIFGYIRSQDDER